MPSRRHPGGHEQLLHVGLRALHLRAVRTWSDDEPTCRAQAISQAVDQRDLGADDDEIRVDVLRAAGIGPDRPGGHRGGHARIAWSDDHLGATGAQGASKGVLPATGADDEDAATHVAEKVTNCSRPGPTPTVRTGTPICSDKKAT